MKPKDAQLKLSTRRLNVAWLQGARGDCSPSSWPLWTLVLGYAVLAAWCWREWGETGWPIGSFWWDELALAGAAEAVRAGLVPTVDFWAPFVLPIYLKHWAIAWTGHGAAFVLENIIQGGVVLALFCWLAGRERQPASVYVVGALAVLGACFPFNFGSVTEAELGTVVAACAYNRLGGSLLALVLLLPAVVSVDDVGRETRLVAWLATVLVVAALLKVTVLQIAWACVFVQVILSPGHGWGRLLIRSSVLALLALAAMAWFAGGWSGYGEALSYLSKLRLSIFVQDWHRYFGFLLFTQQAQLAVLLLVALLIALSGWLTGRRWLRPVLAYLLGCAAVCVYTITNFGDHGVMPAASALCTLLIVWARGYGQLLSLGPPHRVEVTIWRLSNALLLTLVLFYVVVLTYWAHALQEHRNRYGLMNMPLTSSLLARSYLIDADAWALRPDMVQADLPINLGNPSVFASYLVGVDEAAAYLKSNVPDRSQSVYALDFPAYVFSMAAGYRVPKHSFPWLHVGHEVTLDLHPDRTAVLADVDMLLISKCSVSPSNRTYLTRIFRREIEADWRLKDRLTCWDVYMRRAH